MSGGVRPSMINPIPHSQGLHGNAFYSRRGFSQKYCKFNKSENNIM
jgi:hypothetical protein